MEKYSDECGLKRLENSTFPCGCRLWKIRENFFGMLAKQRGVLYNSMVK